MKNHISIKDGFKFLNKSKIKAGDGLSVGNFPFYTSSSNQSKFLNDYEIEDESLIFGTGGSASIHHSKGKFSTSTDCFVIQSNKKYEIDLKYVYFYLFVNMHLLENGFKGAGLKHISKKYLEEIKIPLLPLETQKKIVEALDKAQALVDARKEQIRLMDELVKSRFVEMFGDLHNNSHNWIKAPMGDYLTTLTDFSANGSYEYLDSNVVMYDQPNYALMVRTTDLEKKDFERDVKYIDENAYRILEKSKVFGNEIIMNKIGSAGKVYLMPCLNRPVSLGRNAFLFRYSESINVVYMYYFLTSAYGTNEIMQHVRGAVTKTITKEAVRSVRILVPHIEKQNEFATFVCQIENSKCEMQNSLDEIYTTYQSIAQQFFG